jgi:hypothetical protein
LLCQQRGVIARARRTPRRIARAAARELPDLVAFCLFLLGIYRLHDPPHGGCRPLLKSGSYTHDYDFVKNEKETFDAEDAMDTRRTRRRPCLLLCSRLFCRALLVISSASRVGRMSEALSAAATNDNWRKALRFSALRLLIEARARAGLTQEQLAAHAHHAKRRSPALKAAGSALGAPGSGNGDEAADFVRACGGG